MPPLPGQRSAEAEPGALGSEPVGRRSVAHVDGEAPDVHGALGGEHPAEGLLERAPLLDLGVEQRLLLRRRAEPGRDREPVALGGGSGGGGGDKPSSYSSEAPEAEGTLASDEALAALREKLTGG